ncbi:MAG: mannitol dehydrogenase family protein, partial [Candidatus Latescibacteria bacterium]|nr:mannitol dehydrogenase family protein [Candidatus Latescibacterota bacterium]NIO77053.1 mannitol dehydrogenase family protein [Candidatus Latescibacterota bacterium]
FEAMKLRMLNGTHTAIALIGVLSGLTHVRDVVADPNFKAFLENHMRAV